MQSRPTWQNRISLLAGLAMVVTEAIAGREVGQGNASFDHIVARDISVVDAGGKVRARMSGAMPDAAMADGRISKRGSNAAGFMIYDEQGIERGGYVTQDEGSNAMLTLDNKHSQMVLLVAGPDKKNGAASLQLWNQDSAADLRVDAAGTD